MAGRKKTTDLDARVEETYRRWNVLFHQDPESPEARAAKRAHDHLWREWCGKRQRVVL